MTRTLLLFLQAVTIVLFGFSMAKKNVDAALWCLLFGIAVLSARAGLLEKIK